MSDAGRASAPVILAVDDDPAIRHAISLALHERYAVHAAETAKEARALLRTIHPDLLILDVQLEEEDDDGLRLLAEFRRGSSAPVLVITGHGSEAVAAQAVNLRANAYLIKPFTVEALHARVMELLAEGPRPEHVAERARDLLDDIYAEEVDAAQIARRLGVKPRHLLVAFADRYGRTPMQYLREVRIRRAQELLLSTALPVSDIAVQSGFRDATYFDRVFKQQLGLSPGEFRRTRLFPPPPQD